MTNDESQYEHETAPGSAAEIDQRYTSDSSRASEIRDQLREAREWADYLRPTDEDSPGRRAGKYLAQAGIVATATGVAMTVVL
ncbi:hypothetical protein [Blastococcus sp. VKM Ac-2987]|uniref:hypothetical protein n=1 Tax=Blastococcus sp. VKM Ac-2987 TaxID=3004141 RepID=UPI0022AB683E|nr:hypothetical protein [Blastococcus sp. VKM Ac-2987]MCZ2859179.1 hypothetical protein [Blastococcus sp. VKM Ac-2987]